MSDITLDIEIEDGKVKKSARDIDKEFSKTGKNIGNNLASGLKKVAIAGAALAVATKAVRALTSTFSEALRAAQKQEDAVNRLNSSLIATSRFTQRTSQDFQDFASALQESTRFGDEVILENAALIQSLGDLDQKGLKRATQAALDLSAALKIDLRAAATLVGKAASGEISSFSRYGVIIESGANKAETFANTLTALNSKFGGAATRDVKTYSGALQQLENVTGDNDEILGEFITKARGIGEVVNLYTNLKKEGGESLRVFLKQFDLLDDAILPFFRFSQIISETLVPTLEFGANAFGGFFNFIIKSGAQFVQGFIAVIGTVGEGIGKLVSFFDPDNETAKALQTFGESSREVFLDLGNDALSSFDKIFEFPISDKLATKNQEILEGLTLISETVNEKSGEIQSSILAAVDPEQLTGISSIFDQISNGFKITGNSAQLTSAQIKDANKSIAKFSEDSANNLKKGLGQGAANAFSQFGAAIASGENALGAFTKALIASIGQQAIALGTKFILEGTAYLFTPGFQGLGAGLISSGAALAAFGGAISALSGGGGGASGGSPGTSVSSSGDANGFTTNTANTEPENLERSGVGTTLNLTVQGNVVDQGSFVESIANDLGDAIQGKGLTIRGINA